MLITMLKLIKYSELDRYLTYKPIELYIHSYCNSEPFMSLLVFTKCKIRKKTFNPCLGVRSMQKYWFSSVIDSKWEDQRMRLLAIKGKGIIHMSAPSLLLSSHLKVYEI